MNGDGNDDIVTLELLADIKNQRAVTYMGPITSSTQGQITALGDSTQNAYRELELGDWGEPSQTSLEPAVLVMMSTCGLLGPRVSIT